MKINKCITLLCAAGVLALTGCNGSNNSLNIKKATTYLYEATLDYDFDWSIANEYYKKYKPVLGGCSAISVGNLRGRNYDWEYSNGVEFVVRTSQKTGEKARHSSIGISSLTSFFDDEASDLKYHDQYKMLPFTTLDGINDAGIYVNLNVVGFQQMGKWNMKTETTSDDMCELLSPRLILDKCEYLSDIVPLFDTYDWFCLGNNEETHLMVTGKRSASDPTITTVTFEYIPFTEGENTYRKLCCISRDAADVSLVGNDASRFYQINTKNLIMTNFNLWNYDPSLATRSERLDTTSPLPMGYERYETLEDAAGDKDSVTKNEMADIMKMVYFSNAYSLYKNNFWYTDYTTVTKDQLKGLTDEERNPNGDLEKVSKGEDNKTYLEVQKCVETWKNRDRTKTKEQNLWETIHTSIFDYESKSFRIIPHEGSVYYEYSL